jgi:hypothetical protein
MKARWVWGAVALVAVIAVAATAFALRMRPQLELGVGYAARVACACRHIGNRPLAQCRADFEPGMELIRLREDAAAKRVTASVPLIASRSATFDPLLGCQPDRYDGDGYTIARPRP